MLEQTELPLKERSNMLKNSDNCNLKIRKIKFDRGIPLSLEFPNNKVHTFDYNFKNILAKVFRRVFKKPLIVLLFIILFIVSAIHIIDTSLEFDIGNLVILLVHLFLIFAEICIELYKIYVIYKNDLQTNNQPCHIYDANHKVFIKSKWGEIRVGHIIKVSRNEIVPADIILLETMEQNHLCYVDVSAITGIFDKFLTKKACNDSQIPTMKSVKFSEYVKNIKGMLKIEDNRADIYSFSGRLKLESFPRASDITEENFVMRGSTIKNIKCVYGLVVSTGLDTKILRAIKFEKKSNSSFGFIKENRNMLYNSFLFTQYVLIFIYLLIVLILGLSHLNKFYTINTIIDYHEKHNHQNHEMNVNGININTKSANSILNNITIDSPNSNHGHHGHHGNIENDNITLDNNNSTNSLLVNKNNNITSIYTMFLNQTELNNNKKDKKKEDYFIGIFFNSLDLSAKKPFREFTYSILKILLTFILIIPFNWYTFILIAYYILSLYVSWDIKIIQKFKNTVEVLNSDCLSDFGQVGYILSDKTGTLTSRKFNIKACSIKGRIFSFEPSNSTDGNILFKNKMKDLSDLEIYQELKKNTVLSKYIKEFFELICVCNTAKLINAQNNLDENNENNNNENNNNDNINNENNNKKDEKILGASFAEDISLMKLLKLLGYQILKTNTDLTEIEADDLKKTFYMVGKNKFSEERQRMSVVVKKSKEESDSILICKGYDLSIFDLINDSDEAQLKLIIEQIKRLTQIGYRFIIVCKKELNEEETLNFVTRYKSAENYIFQKDLHFEELALDYENDLELLGVLFFEEKISSDLRYTINKLNNFNINTWIVSGDSKDNVLAVARNLDMYKSNALICEFLEYDDEDDLDIKMNLFLSQFFSAGEDNENFSKIRGIEEIGSNANQNNKSKAKGKEFTILIHGECFRLICNDMRLYQCFTSLLSYTTKLFAYKFSPYNKYLLCKTVKMYLTKPSNSKVLAVGDGVNDFMMLKEADLSIGIRSKEILQVKNTCDVIVSKFSQITDLIFVHGTWNYDRICKILFFSSYSNILIVFPFFLYNGNFIKGAAFLELNFLKLIFDIIIINLMIIFIFCLNTNIDRALIGLNPNIYFENFQKKKSIIIKYIKVVLLAFVDASIIYYGSTCLINPSMNLLGQNTDSTILAMSINFICYNLIMIKLILLNLSLMNSFILIIYLLIIGILFGFSYIDQDYVITIYQSLSYFGNILAMIIIIAICFLHEGFVMYYHLFFNPDFIQTVKARFNIYIKDYILFIKFDDILKDINLLNVKTSRKFFNRFSIFRDVLQSIYDEFKTIDPVLDNLIDINNDEMVKMKIDPYSLTYRDNGIETDYKYENFSLMHDSFFYYIICIIIFCIVDMVIEIYEGNLDKDKISKIIKLFILFCSLMFLLKRIKINFSHYFQYYFYLNIVIDLVLLYVEKGNNQTKLCFLFFINFSFPTLIPGSNFYSIKYGVIFYALGMIPAIFVFDSPYVKEFNMDNLYLEESISQLPLLYHKTLLITGILGILLFYGFYEEYLTRLNYLKYNKKSNDMKKNNEIYSNLVPSFVREKMKNGIRGAAIDFEVVTILFCDISDFDGFVASMSPKELIQLLDRIYNIFDQLCSLHGLQKIETVGKTYMAAAGLKECEKDIDPFLCKRNAAVRTFELSLDMIDAIDKIILENGERVKIKVGVHTGKIIAAVVGNHKPQFSLIGDAVNTTARMCAYSSDMCVLCSESAYENIKNEYTDFQVNKKEVKGKGVMNIYLHNPNKPKNENKNKDKKRLTETKFLNNLNFNLNNKKVPKKPNNNKDHNNNNIVMQNKKKGNNIHRDRETSVNFNRDNFIFENSFENNSNPNNFDPRKRQKPAPKFLSRLVTHREDNNFNVNVSLNELQEKNHIWQKSFFFLKFYDQHSEEVFEQYSQYRFKNNSLRSYISIFIYSLIMLVAVYNLSEYNAIKKNVVYFMIFFKIFLVILLMILAHFNQAATRQYKGQKLQFFIWLICFLITIIITIQMNSMNADYISINLCLEQILTTLFLSSNGILKYKYIVFNLILYVFIFILNIIINLDKMIIIKYNVFMIIICIIIFIFLIIRYYKSTGSYLKNFNESQNLKKIEELLFNLMPQHVVLNLKEDIPVADVLDDVTLLFADIVKFTDYSSSREPTEVVRMLSELFKEFDDSCKNLNCYKVHTIGDCYVVMSFTGKVPLNERNFKDEANNVVKMGQSMIEIIKKVREKVNFLALDMRIGLHTGTVIAGIVGTKVVRYDIFGSDVLIANKMESNGIVGKIAVSEDTKNLLEFEDGENREYNYNFTPHKTVNVSSVNREIKSYIISNNEE